MSGMPVPSIPDLRTLRSSRGGAGPRRRGGIPSATASSVAGHDATIQGTDTDAAVSRMSAVDQGYLKDPYAQFFITPPHVANAVRRLPIINRGTYTRTTALDRLISHFLSATEGQQRQIISLGAGTDTRAFRLLKDENRAGLTYHEIDYPAVTSKKYQTTQSTPELRSAIPGAVYAEETQTWHDEAGRYFCHGVDLRDLRNTSLTGLLTEAPTLLISECCLCYLEPPQASAVINHFTERIPRIACVIYEPVYPNDPFGRQMVSNLAARRIRMPTLAEYADTDKQAARLRAAGFGAAVCLTVERIWHAWIPAAEKERVDALEGLDEVEEWNLLAGHYCVSFGWRGIDLPGWQMGPG